ncbi:heme oxygenase [Halospina denitrificans]|uniref:Heme oxygenase n=1 Tax=Halospina denitrificans TaxID=332522 RepID=A0A4R7JYB9_9GAMM|nr:heme oxygenase [Halospina denitrificans]
MLENDSLRQPFARRAIRANLEESHCECPQVISSNTPTQTRSLADRLRAETRPEHNAIETALDLPQSIQDAGDYTRLLSGFHGFYLPLEQALLRLDWEGTGIDLNERLKAPLIRTDLEACGADADSVPQCPTLPPCSSLAEGFGCLYVMEGATLGGAMIHRELSTRFEDWLSGKDHYYQCYGENRGSMWRQFRQAVDGFGEGCSSADQDRVIHSARATFRELQRWLER